MQLPPADAKVQHQTRLLMRVSGEQAGTRRGRRLTVPPTSTITCRGNGFNGWGAEERAKGGGRANRCFVQLVG